MFEKKANEKILSYETGKSEKKKQEKTKIKPILMAVLQNPN